MTKGVFKSKEVMYLVVQKSTETQGFKSLPLPADLREIILKLSQSSGIFSIGIPIETDDLKGSFKMAELCNQVTATWMNNWSHQKNMPELFLCAATSTENVLEMVNRSFKTSRGFSKRNFLAVDEGTSG